MTVDPQTSLLPTRPDLSAANSFESAQSPSAVPATPGSPDRIDLSRDARAIAARDGERGPALFTLSSKEQSQLESGRSTTQGHGWHDDANSAALLLRANASPAYVGRYVSPFHLQEAYRIDSARDERADASLNRAVSRAVTAVSDTISEPKNAVQSTIATGKPNVHPTSAESDANRATIRHKLADTLSESGDPEQHAIGAAYANYDHSPHAVRGALDVALDTATDPLTYATLGADAIGGVAARVVAQAPRIIDALGESGSAVLRGLDNVGASLTPSLSPAGATTVGSVDRIGAADLGRLEKTRIVDGAQTPRQNYGVDEASGGHTVKRHIGLSDRQLRTRLNQNNNMRSVSTFTNEASASKAWSAMNKSNGAAIAIWKKGTSEERLKLTVNVGSTIGRILSRGSDDAIGTSSARFFLEKDSSQRGWHVVTSFPVIK